VNSTAPALARPRPAVPASGRSKPSRFERARAVLARARRPHPRHGLPPRLEPARQLHRWGNFVQTYSMVGLVSAAIRLSIRWDQAF